MTDRLKPDGPRTAKLAIVGMGPARDEMSTGRYFTGASGRLLNDALMEIGHPREKCFVTNICDTFIPPGMSLFAIPPSEMAFNLERLKIELTEVKPNVVLALGDETVYFLTGNRGIMKWRGSILPSTLVPGLKVVAAPHPAWIIRGMWKWLPVFKHIDVKRAVEESASPEINYPERDALTGPGLSTIEDYCELIAKEGICCFDIETYGFTEHNMGEIACVGVGYRPNQALCIPLTRSYGQPYWDLPRELKVWRAIARLLENPNVRKVGQNIAFDWLYFWFHNVYPQNLWMDTLTAHHTLYPDFGGTSTIWKRNTRFEEPGHGLAFINSQYTRTPYYKDDGRKWEPALGEHQFWRYNAMDVMTTLDVALQMETELKEEKLWDFYNEYLIEPFLPFLRTEWFGVAIDLEKRRIASRELGEQAKRLQAQIDKTVGRALNVNSPVQMQQLFYRDKKYQVKKNKKTGKPTVDKEALEFFAQKYNDPVVRMIRELKHTLDVKGDIVDQPLGSDNRMHTHYNLGGTDSGRLSSIKSILGTGTNLQNVPRDGIARELFVAG